MRALSAAAAADWLWPVCGSDLKVGEGDGEEGEAPYGEKNCSRLGGRPFSAAAAAN